MKFYLTIAVLVIVWVQTGVRADTHPVLIRATVKTVDGTPLSQVPLALTTGKQNGYGLTDAEGVLAVTLQADSQSFSRASARLRRHFRRPDLQSMKAVAIQRYDELTEQYFFQTAYVTETASTATEVDIQVTAFPAVTLTATVGVSPAPQPSHILVWIEGGVFSEPVKTGEQIAIKGVRKDSAGQLLWCLEGGELAWTGVTAAQTAGDSDLGPLVVNRHIADSQIDLTVTNRVGLIDESVIPIDDCVFLVRSDGQAAYSFMVDANNRVIGGPHEGRPSHNVQVSSGTYYIIPGSPGGVVERKLRAIVVAGQLQLLDTAGVPKFVAQAGQTVAYELDASAALTAIKAVAWP